MNKKKKLRTWQKALIVLVGVFAVVLSVKALNESETITFSGEETTYLEYGQTFNTAAIKIYINNKLSSKTPTIDLSGINYDKLGEYQIVIQYINDKGKLIHEEVRKVVIKDTKRPTIKLLGDWSMTITQGTTFEDPGYEAKDNYDDAEDIAVEVTGKVDSNTIGTYTITYKATDSSGNYTSTKRVVEVEEKKATVTGQFGSMMRDPQGNKGKPGFPGGENKGITALELIGEATMYLEYLTPYIEPGYTAIDTKDGDITGKVVVTGSVDEEGIGSYELVYSITNSSGVITQVTRTVIVYVDSPIITLEPDTEIYTKTNEAPYNLDEIIRYGVKAENAFGEDITVDITYTCYDAGEEISCEELSNMLEESNYLLTGTFTIKYEVIDQWGNSAVPVERILILTDTSGKD